jgi:hypothetical protein
MNILQFESLDLELSERKFSDRVAERTRPKS